VGASGDFWEESSSMHNPISTNYSNADFDFMALVNPSAYIMPPSS